MNGLNRIFALLLALALLAALLTTSLFVVDQRQYAMVYGSGQLQRLVQEPGLQFKWPWPLQELRVLDRRTLLTTGNTGDAPVIVTQNGRKQRWPLAWYVQWRIANPQQYLQQVGHTVDAGAARLNDLVQAAVRTELAHVTQQHALADSAVTALQQKLRQQIHDAASKGDKPMGLQVLAVRLVRVDVDQDTARAMQARMQADLQQLAEQTRQETARAVAAMQVEAEGQRQALLAEGERQALQIRGEGDAQAIAIYAPDHALNPQLASFLRALTAYRKSFGSPGDVLVIDPAANGVLQSLRTGNTQAPVSSAAVIANFPAASGSVASAASAPGKP